MVKIQTVELFDPFLDIDTLLKVTRVPEKVLYGDTKKLYLDHILTSNSSFLEYLTSPDIYNE